MPPPERTTRRPPRRDATDAEAKALASALRLRILRVCLHEPRTNRQIAEMLGRDPATVLHHVRRLVDTGFLRGLDPRRGTRGAREIPYVATGKSWTLTAPGHELALLDAFAEEVALVPAQDVHTLRMGLRLSPADKADFEARLEALVEQFRGLPPGAGAADWSLFVAVHPDPNSPATDRARDRPKHVVGVESVGYEGRTIEVFVADLTARGVELVADVRLNATSRKPGFAKTALRTALGEAGIDYVHLRALGNPRENRPLFARADPTPGRRAYRALLDAPQPQAALAELRTLAARRRVALLCFEADETHCHRRVLRDLLGP